MAHIPHAFENQIFDHYRTKAKEINTAIELLLEHNYRVIDLQGNFLVKTNEEKKTIQE
jgi:hypothetical protein|tara:strand:+ start:175 stop:348 length:174 start_codon:yes stop_codon:yes gene_type:complete